MTTRNILILSIVFVEFLFLGYTSTYEFSSIDTEEMKTAVHTILKVEIEKQKIQEVVEEARRISCNEIDKKDVRRISCNEVDENEMCGMVDGTITISSTGKGTGLSCISIDGGINWSRFHFEELCPEEFIKYNIK